MNDEEDFETVGRGFEAQFPGRCAIVYEHKIQRGDLVSRVQRADNPMLPVPGVACKVCTRLIPRAKR